MSRALTILLTLRLLLGLPLGAKADFSPDPNDPPTTTGGSGTRQPHGVLKYVTSTRYQHHR